MNLQTIHTNFTGDNLLLSSTADYFESRVERAMQCVDDISDMIAHAQEVGYTPPAFDYSLSVVDGDATYRIDAAEFKQHVLAGHESYETVVQGTRHIVVTIENVIDQLKDSLLTNRIMIESLYSLRDAGASEISTLTSLFINRLQLRIGEVTDTASSLGTRFLNVLTQSGVSVGDRLRNLLNFIGIYNVNEDNPPIGIPSSELTDITGSNVYQAWFSEVPNGIREFIDWLVDAVKKVVQMLKSVVQIVLGSSLYRSLKKFVLTLTLQADSFAYNQGTEDGLSIDSHGKTFKIKGQVYSAPWLQYGSSTIYGIVRCLYAAFFKDSWTLPGSDINSILGVVCQKWHDQEIEADAPISGIVMQLADHPDPYWVHDPTSWSSDIRSKIEYLYCAIGNRYYNFGSNYGDEAPFSDYDMLSYIIGAIMDYGHINDVGDFTKHLYSNQYMKIDLPCSTLYFWLVGNDIYCTRRVSPCVRYAQSDNFDEVINDLQNAYGFQPYLSFPRIPNVRLNLNTYYGFINDLRSSNDIYVESDREMRNSVWAAHVIDASYLAVLAWAYRNGDSFDGDHDWIVKPIGEDDMNLLSYFQVLTGYSVEDYRSRFESLANDQITNLTLAQMVGATTGIPTYDANSTAMLPFFAIMHYINDPDLFVPYSQVGMIDAGRYHVITNSELADILVTTIKIVAVVIATVYVLKVMKGLKRKALSMRTQADAVAWKMVDDGAYTQEAIDAQYKLQRKADLCQKCAEALFGSVSKVVSTVGTTLRSSMAALTAKVKQTLSGSRTVDNDQISISDIADILKPRS